MLIKDELKNDWDRVVEINSRDGYSNATVAYAITWANLMEKEIEKWGELTKEIVSRTSYDADEEGVTGFMANCVFGLIKQFWFYRERLEGLNSIYDF